MRELRRLGRLLGVDHELGDAAAVAEVDEDEAAVVAPARRPAGKGEPLADQRRGGLAAHVGRASVIASSLPRTSACATGSSCAPWRRTIAPAAPTITVVGAPDRPAWVSWPLSERPA